MLSVVALLLLASCSNSEPSADESNEPTPSTTASPTSDDVGGVIVDNETDLVLGLSLQSLERTFFQGVDSGATLEAEELGVELVVFEAGDSPEKQRSDVVALLEADVDGIIISPVDSAQAPELADLVADAGVPLLAVASQIGSVEEFSEQHVYEGTVALVTNDDIDMGSKAAEILADEVGDQPVNIAVLQGAIEASNTSLRDSGFTSTLDGLNVNYEIIAEAPGDWTAEGGGAACQALFEQSPEEIDILFSMSDAMTTGCVETLTPEQLAGVDIVSIGGNEEGISLLQDGLILGTVCQKPATMGALALETLVIAVRTGQVDQGLTFYQTPKITLDSIDDCEPQW